MKRRNRYQRRKLTLKILFTAMGISMALISLMPIVLTITNSFMAESEITANYGAVFGASTQNSEGTAVTSYISQRVNLKFIPDMVSFSQYWTVLFNSPEYLLKLWNSIFLTVPVVVFQVAIASFAAYGFTRYRGRVRESIFFGYIILMLMPYQVTLVPNYLVSKWLNLLDTRWAVILPGIFAPFSVFLLTKNMRRIPKSYLEAAQLDGAGEWRLFSSVCLPMCKGCLVSVAMLVFIDYWNMVEQPLILFSDQEMYPLSVFLSEINSGEVGVAFAVAVIYMIPTLLMFLWGEEYLEAGITYSGGIKG
ncbi:MAG: carbohydrate ABC transporter permease [Oscillospiraceae bacterium]|nr:carbohydrate ABC transporter permease [Oscillospiraceae bacterium]